MRLTTLRRASTRPGYERGGPMGSACRLSSGGTIRERRRRSAGTAARHINADSDGKFERYRTSLAFAR